MAATKKAAPRRPGPKARTPYTRDELGAGAIALHRGLDVALQILRKPPRQRFALPEHIWLPMKAAITAYLDAVSPVKKKRLSLVRAAVALATGDATDRVFVDGIEIVRTPKLRAAITRKDKTAQGKAYAIYKIIALTCGVDVPRRNAPEADLARMFKEELARERVRMRTLSSH